MQVVAGSRFAMFVHLMYSLLIHWLHLIDWIQICSSRNLIHYELININIRKYIT